MDIRKSVRAQYLKFLDREPNLDDLDYYSNELETNRIELNDLILILRNSNESKELLKHQKIPELETCSTDTYNDIRIKGKIISSGYRNSEKRYDEIFKFCKKFNRPISVLDLGAAEGYFTFKLSEDFPGVFIAVENNPKKTASVIILIFIIIHLLLYQVIQLQISASLQVQSFVPHLFRHMPILKE